jgi:hypothetical protein
MALRQWKYNLVNHHQCSRFGVFNTFHIPKDVDSVPLIQAAVELLSYTRCRLVGVSRLEEEDVGPRIFGTKVDVAEDTGANSCLGSIEYQTRVDVYDCGALEKYQSAVDGTARDKLIPS